jgi:hypothetical protein
MIFILLYLYYYYNCFNINLFLKVLLENLYILENLLFNNNQLGTMNL